MMHSKAIRNFLFWLKSLELNPAALTTLRQNSLRFLIAGFLTTCLHQAACAGQSPRVGQGQLGQPLENIPATAEESPGTLRSLHSSNGTHALMWKVQRSIDDTLYLTANESFFPSLGLKCIGQGQVPDGEQLNGGKSFAAVTGWKPGLSAEWGLHTEKTGQAQAKIWMTTKKPGRFVLSLGSRRHSFSIRPSATPTLVATVELECANLGFSSLFLTCEAAATDTELNWIELSGPAISRAAVVRKRWRPAAAHTKFSSSRASQPVRLWVMEMDAVPGTLDFYSPITTPFGYYGPTWKADGRVNPSFNFSLWSYGRGKKEPPVEQLSHLLAIGNRDATFGGFGHEGTGVKIRGWEPLEGHLGQRQALALRVEPGTPYDTYYSYFYLADEKRWQLFGAGNKFNGRKPLKSLWVGSFVEVPGPPHVQRTGAYPRTMRYRGWIMLADGTWHQLDQMENGNIDRQSGLTHTDRGITDDGWFYLQTGGWVFRKAGSAPQTRLANRSDRLPTFLSEKDIRSLTSVDSEIRLIELQKRGSTLEGTYGVNNVSKHAEVTLYWGAREGLTFADRWEHSTALAPPVAGKNSFTVPLKDSNNSPIHARLFLKNDNGQFWSSETFRLK